MLVVCNLTPVPRLNYVVGVPRGGYWREALNSDAKEYGGSGMGNFGGAERRARAPRTAAPILLALTLPPLSVLFFESHG